jgi:DNA-binding NtrC family response regulator
MKKRILILDDEKEICFLLSALLKQMGYHAEYAYTLQEAITRIRNPDTKYDIIFVDLNLPDGLGYYLIPEVKQANPDTKVIMISAHDSMLRQIKKERDEIDFYIDKPFNKEKISQAIYQVTH